MFAHLSFLSLRPLLARVFACLVLVSALSPVLAAAPATPAAPFERLHAMDGSAAAPVVTLADWRQAVFDLRRLNDAAATWPGAFSLAERLRRETSSRTVPLGVVHARMPGADPAAGPGTVFVVAPLRERIFDGAEVVFELAPEALLTDGAAPVVQWWFDAGDGRGRRTIGPGEPIAVTYATTGPKRLELSARTADGTVLRSVTQAQVQGLVTPEPTETWPVTASIPFDGAAGSGLAYVYLAEGHASLTNPVVIVEGFDLDNTMDWPVLYNLLNQQNLLEDLRALGYDAVVLDFTEAVGPIQRNAFVLTELLQMVHAEIPAGQTIALVGASAGGLVSRYALLWFEDAGLPHRVRNWISFDSPHGGANVPLGLQAWLRFFASQSAEADFLLGRLRTPGARQMLLYHVDSTAGTTPQPDPLRAALGADFAALGGWPQDTRRVAIINGSGTMAGQGFAPGDQLLEWEFLGGEIEVIGNVWALPDGGPHVIFDGLLASFIGSLTETLTVDGAFPWDNAPGGYSATLDAAASVDVPYGDIVALHSTHAFVPTVSALALGAVDPFHDPATPPGLPQASPFDQVYVPALNEEHVAITADNKAWFLIEIQLNPPGPVFGDGFEDAP